MDTTHYRFIASENTTMDAAYFAALTADADLGRTRGIDATLKKFNLDAILLPTDGTPVDCQTETSYLIIL